uniref:Uncharacterized protein n=1 Tax=Opuntia streptacantha TaxID=393608 RepID=A0A7C9B2X3_OPUST
MRQKTCNIEIYSSCDNFNQANIPEFPLTDLNSKTAQTPVSQHWAAAKSLISQIAQHCPWNPLTQNEDLQRLDLKDKQYIGARQRSVEHINQVNQHSNYRRTQQI